jgi:polar amino acid transport system permease protein
MIRPFGLNEALFIIDAAKWTIVLFVIACSGGAAIGLIVALARVSKRRSRRVVATGFIRFFQGTPLLMQLFLVFFGLNTFGMEVAPLGAASIALILHASAFLGEIWRGCIQAVPKGQAEASAAVGLRYYPTMRCVILPQAARIAIAPTVGFMVQLIKGTSLASFVGFVEITRAGQIINNSTFSPLPVFGLVTALYFALCWPISLLAARVEAKSGSRKVGERLALRRPLAKRGAGI